MWCASWARTSAPKGWRAGEVTLLPWHAGITRGLAHAYRVSAHEEVDAGMTHCTPSVDATCF